MTYQYHDNRRLAHGLTGSITQLAGAAAIIIGDWGIAIGGALLVASAVFFHYSGRHANLAAHVWENT